MALNSSSSIDRETTMEAHILKVAEDLFMSKGYALTSTTEIAERVGCNQALIHYYYRTKDKLFEAIFFEKLTSFVSMFFEIDEQELDFEERLRRKIGLHYDFLSANPRLPFFLINELTTNPERMREVGKALVLHPIAVMDSFEKDLKAAIERGEIRSITLMDLMLNIAALNVITFMAEPILCGVFEAEPKLFESARKERKAEVIQTILKSLKP